MRCVGLAYGIRAFATLAAFLAAGACAPAAYPVNVPAPAHAAIESRIDSIFAHFGPTTPGCAVGVYRAGEIVFAKGYGMADLEHGVPVTPTTVFDIASNSKQFTAFAVQLLARQGKLSLDDDMRKHIPELPELGAVTTLRHLLHNTSGLRDFGDLRTLQDPGWTREQPITRAEVLELLARQRALSFVPGDRYLYSNTNWLLLAMVVERVDGRAFPDFMEQEVFRPLGMASTLVRADPMGAVPVRAVSYAPLPAGTYRVDNTWGLARELAGPRGVHSTLADLARWDAEFYEERVGGPGIAHALYAPGVLASGDTVGYASGLRPGWLLGRRALWHGSADGGDSEMIRFPEERLSVAVLCNQYGASSRSHEFARRVAAVFLPPVEPSLAAHASGVVLATEELARFAGLYQDLESGDTGEFFVDEGALAEFGHASYDWPIYRLVALGDGRFEDDDVHIRFAADGSELAFLNKLSGSMYRHFRIDPRFWTWAPTALDLTSYAGRYASDELDVSWEVMIAEDAATLRRSGTPDIALQPLAPDLFRAAGMTITFVRDAAGSVAGLHIDTERALNVAFTRARDQ